MSSSFISTARPRGRGWVAAGVFTATLAWAAQASAQECGTDTDCDFGFVCELESAGTTGAGGFATGFCGDALCEAGEEDAESCPEDCIGGGCVPASCESHDDCAQGYECGPSGGETNSSSIAGTTAGGSIVCGDGMCAGLETIDNCRQDCGPDRQCQPAHNLCNEDSECARGFFCDTSFGGGSVGAVNSEGGIITEWYEGVCTAEGTGGGEGGAAGGLGEAGASGENDVTTITASSSSSTTGASVSSNAGGAGSNDSSSSGGSAGRGGSGAGGVESSSDGAGDSDDDDGPGRRHKGCSVAATPSPNSRPLLFALALGAVLTFGRRRKVPKNVG